MSVHFSGEIPSHVSARLMTASYLAPNFCYSSLSLPLFDTIRDYSLFVIRDHSVFVIRDYSLFGFFRHPGLETISINIKLHYSMEGREESAHR